jgi:hypothetical protein
VATRLKTLLEMHAERVERFPEFKALDAIADSFGAGREREMLAALQRPFSALLRGDVTRRCIEEQLVAMKADPDYFVRDASPESFTLYRSQKILLHVRIPRERLAAEPASAELSSLAGHALCGSIGPGPLTVELFREDETSPASAVDPSKVLTARGPIVLEPGEHISLVAGRDIITVPAPQDTATYMRLDLPEVNDFVVIYDRKSLRPTYLTGVNQVDEQLLYVLRIAAAVGDKTTVPLVVSTIEHHQAHHVRWEALQTLVALDPGVAVQQLRKTLHDPHPELRAVAQSSLPKLEAALAGS